RLESELGPRPFPVDLEWNLIGERMADEGCCNAMLRVERGLEGQQTEHQVTGAADLADPPLPPRPGLTARGDHLWPCDPEALEVRDALAQRRDERGAELISG